MKEISKKSVECLLLLGFLEKYNFYEWGDPFYPQQKIKQIMWNFLVTL